MVRFIIVFGVQFKPAAEDKYNQIDVKTKENTYSIYFSLQNGEWLNFNNTV
jgi:hypothetical protein